MPDEVAHQRAPKPHIIKQQSSDNEDSTDEGQSSKSSNSCSSLDSIDETLVSNIGSPEQQNDILNKKFIISEIETLGVKNNK